MFFFKDSSYFINKLFFIKKSCYNFVLGSKYGVVHVLTGDLGFLRNVGRRHLGFLDDVGGRNSSLGLGGDVHRGGDWLGGRRGRGLLLDEGLGLHIGVGLLSGIGIKELLGVFVLDHFRVIAPSIAPNDIVTEVLPALSEATRQTAEQQPGQPAQTQDPPDVLEKLAFVSDDVLQHFGGGRVPPILLQPMLFFESCRGSPGWPGLTTARGSRWWREAR